jgi:hypothetical protein
LVEVTARLGASATELAMVQQQWASSEERSSVLEARVRGLEEKLIEEQERQAEMRAEGLATETRAAAYEAEAAAAKSREIVTCTALREAVRERFSA